MAVLVQTLMVIPVTETLLSTRRVLTKRFGGVAWALPALYNNVGASLEWGLGVYYTTIFLIRSPKTLF